MVTTTPRFITRGLKTRSESNTNFNLLEPSGFLYVPPGLKFKNSTRCWLCGECFVWVSEQTATLAVYNINSLVFITVVESVYSAVRTDSLYKADCFWTLKS